jgi:hypothetical protein
MDRRTIVRAVVCVGVSTGLFAAAFHFVSCLRAGQGQEERPKFYVSRVISEQNVKNGLEVVGKPDGRYAEVAPSGQMVLWMESRIYPSTTLDDGTVVCKGDASFGLEGWFLVAGTKESPQFAWMPLAAGMSPGGFRLSSESLERTPEGSPGVNMIRISNNGTAPMLLDAVVGYGR